MQSIWGTLNPDLWLILKQLLWWSRILPKKTAVHRCFPLSCASIVHKLNYFTWVLCFSTRVSFREVGIESKWDHPSQRQQATQHRAAFVSWGTYDGSSLCALQSIKTRLLWLFVTEMTFHLNEVRESLDRSTVYGGSNAILKGIPWK